MGTGRDHGDRGPSEFDAMVARVIDRASIPGRAGEPKLASNLVAVEQVGVGTRHGRVAAWRVGVGPAVLLVHGWRDSTRLWDPLMKALTARGRSFVAFDLPGHGSSDGDRCLTAEVADAVAAVAAALAPVNSAVAHSFATGGTALAAAEGTSVERLVLIAPPLAYRAPGDAAGDATDASHQRWRRIAGELGFDAGVGDAALNAYRESLGPSRSRWDLTDGLAELAAEVLFLASVDDERFDVNPARALTAQLSHCALVELAGRDHRGSARGPNAVDAMVRFLDHGVAANTSG